ncbi:EGF-like repeat and discoidin I-like domain-containing protein 3 [Collichthys lucidus]|uniref:EGF-like repeat and discoidin I-like domain-containing protein 3 n=1 Tax=Collichthys lucidus TaxID=240159 RepID=A0A4U5UHB2_COLLU|nr:EGF-like repeat and discoidin I-like domain-containing protein 3 [Collichthys lucidus]
MKKRTSVFLWLQLFTACLVFAVNVQTAAVKRPRPVAVKGFRLSRGTEPVNDCTEQVLPQSPEAFYSANASLKRVFVFSPGHTACVTSVAGEYCKENVCNNGGTCVTGAGTPFICICPDGFSGETCNETETGPCNPNPCKNDATCELTGHSRRGDVFNEYVCKCQPGFDGVHCQNSVRGADLSSPKGKGGMGTRGKKDMSVFVFCAYGFLNPGSDGVFYLCADVNDCAGQPCENGGTCRDLDGDFKCHCPSPYVGKHCQLRCISLLGLEGGGIAESQITASSVRYSMLGLQRWGPELVRLHNKGLVNAWSAAAHDKNPWIEINMQRKMRFTGIVTQGASRIGTAEFIKAFKVASSLDGKTYTMYRTEGERKDRVFVGNVDNDGTKTNLFDPPIIAQYIRIIPVVCRKACTLRMELVGCELNVCSNTSGCSEPMGLKSRLVSNNQITASSTFRTWGIEAFTWHPHYARLDKQGKTNAWTAATNNRSEWLQVDLHSPKKITGIITQGAKDFGNIQFVTAFKVAHSDDGRSWTIVKDETYKDRQGNSDNNVHKNNIFDPPFYGRYVRILPWEWHDRITLRIELLGCDE